MSLPCRRCGRRGLPPRAPGLELCEACEAAIAEEVQARLRRIHEALEVLGDGAGLSAKQEGCSRILQEAEALQRYEVRGILTMCPPPSTVLRDFRAMREALARRGARAREASPASGEADPGSGLESA